MSAEWRGNLRNSRTDVFIDTTATILTLCAYHPQILSIRASASTKGISAYYVLFNILFSNAQLSEMLLCTAAAWPNARSPLLEQVSDGSLKGREAFGGILGLLQIFVQWSCAIILLLSFAAHAQAEGPSGRKLLIIVGLHIAAVLLPAAVFALPRPPAHREFGTDILLALISMSNQVVAPCFIVLQFCVQIREMKRQSGNPGALSLLSVGLQVLALATLAVRWLLRLGRPTWHPAQRAPIWLWYQWGFPAINYASCALGCVLLLASYAFSAGRTVKYGNLEDQTPLLR